MRPSAFLLTLLAALAVAQSEGGSDEGEVTLPTEVGVNMIASSK